MDYYGYKRGNPTRYQLALVATEDNGANTAMFREGKETGVWVSTADDPAHRDFILSSVLNRGDVVFSWRQYGGACQF